VTDLPELELFRVTAHLLQAGLVSLQEILPHVCAPNLGLIAFPKRERYFSFFFFFQLSPSDGEIEATFAEMMKEATTKAKKLGVVSLAVRTSFKYSFLSVSFPVKSFFILFYLGQI